MDDITITISIMDRPYKLTIARNDEERVRKAVSLINERVKLYAKHYAFKEPHDLLAMTALQFATAALKYESDLAYNGQHLEQKLNELNALLSEQP